MARVVYGVAGEGFGHSSRAREMVSYIELAGHEVKVVSYDKGYRSLKSDFDVFETEGLHIASSDNAVSVVRTLTDNIQRLPRGQKKLVELRNKLFRDFQPDCVITDFEPMTAYLANHYDLPLITIDNQHRLRYMDYPCPSHLKGDRLVTVNIIRAMVPRPDVSLVISFYAGNPRNDRTLIFPPILRSEVLSLQPSSGSHILVYLTSGFESLYEKLKLFKREQFLIYGCNRDDIDGNLCFKPFTKNDFLHDLATCKAVMATAGFTLITESLYLRKPYLAMPLRGQFEQEINGFLLDRLGYGVNLRRTVRQAIGDFLYRLPDFQRNLNEYPASDNSAIKAKIKELLANECAMAKEFHSKRAV